MTTIILTILIKNILHCKYVLCFLENLVKAKSLNCSETYKLIGSMISITSVPKEKSMKAYIFSVKSDQLNLVRVKSSG